jgi:hypothetical protein
MREKVAHLRAATSSARQRISDAGHAAREQASRIGEGARDRWERARDGYDYVAHEQPLALGAIGFAVGAALAALLPRTRTEDTLMGDASDDVKQEATNAVRRQAENLERAAAGTTPAQSRSSDGALQGSARAQPANTPVQPHD